MPFALSEPALVTWFTSEIRYIAMLAEPRSSGLQPSGYAETVASTTSATAALTGLSTVLLNFRRFSRALTWNIGFLLAIFFSMWY